MKKKSKLEKLTPVLLGTCMLTLVAACGSDDDDSNSSPQQQSEQQEGTYTGALTPLNSQISGMMAISGAVSVRQEADEFEAKVDVTGATAASHPQFIYTGSRCPTTADDTNGDGYVDAVEGTAAAGQMLIPLDSDLRSQSAGGSFPSGATYEYDEDSSYLALLADLRLPDTDTSDAMVKLGATEELNLGSRVVVIHGVPASTTLPPTVQGVDGLSPQQALPVACAVLSRTDAGSTTGTTTGTTGGTTGDTGTTTGGTTGDTGTTTGGTTGDTGTTTGDTGTTTGTTGTTTGDTGATTGV